MDEQRDTRPRITRDVAPSALRDLATAPPRATVAFVERGVELLPARARFTDDGHRFAVRSEDAPDLAGREVVVVIDDGPYWFELRGLSVRGVAARIEPEPDADLAWYRVEARRVLAWDYATLREKR